MSFDGPDLPETKRSSHHWFDLLISICALITSALSMYVAFNNDQSLERLVHANSWPFLQLESGNTGADGSAHDIYFSVKNAGTGPARIFSFEFLVDDHPIANNNTFVNMARACCDDAYRQLLQHADPHDPFVTIGSVITAPMAPDVLAPHDEQNALSWSLTNDNRALWSTLDQARQHGRIGMRACYCSVFDECWIGRTGTLPVRVNACQMQHNSMLQTPTGSRPQP